MCLAIGSLFNSLVHFTHSATAPSVQRLDSTAEIIAQAQRQLDAIAPPVGMVSCVTGGPPQHRDKVVVQA